ncbi:MAG: hypothetical protein NC117_01715 [Pseudoflavonifractor sp.]|nr:hypothetical protein [Pseudoflavonifractor sp.]
MSLFSKTKAKVVTMAVIVTVAGIVCAGLYLVYGRDRGSHGVKLDTTRYPIRGIDISGHNGTVDFERVKADGIEFVVIKASEGATFKDNRFHDNYRKARDAGLKRGAYHFFRFDVDGKLQGLNFIHSIGGKVLDLPPVIDIEDYNNARNIPTSLIVSRLQSLIDHIESRGYKVMLYTNKNGYNRFLRGRFEEYPLWICSFTDPPIDRHRHWTLWQYSHWGRVDGCSGVVDLNTFNGDSTLWASRPKAQ